MRSKVTLYLQMLSLLLCGALFFGCLTVSAKEAEQWPVPENSLLSSYVHEPWKTTPYPEISLFSGRMTSQQATSTVNYQLFLGAAPEQYLLSREQIKGLCLWKAVSDSDLTYVEQKAREITRNCTTDYEKIYAVNKYLSQNVCYDYDYFSHNAYPYTQLNLNPRDVLVNESTVCSGYAVTAASMLQLLGIPCVYVDSPDHAWNIAHDGTRWVMFDATWCSLSRMEYGIKEKNPNLRMEWFDFSLDQANGNTNHLIDGLPSPSGSLPQPYISMHPLDHDILTTDTLTLLALSGNALSCQWYVHTERATSGGTPIPGAVENLYTLSNQAPGTYYYYAVMTDSSGRSNTSYPARVRVFEGELPSSEGLIGVNLRYQYFDESGVLRLTGSGAADEDTLEYAGLYFSALEIGSTVTHIPDAITENFYWSSSVTVDAGNPVFSTDENGVLLNNRDGVLLLLPDCDLSSYAIPEGIVRVAKNAIQISSLTSLSIPASLRELPGGLGQCRLETITVHPDNPVFSLDETGALIHETSGTLVRAPISSYGQSYVVDEEITQIEDYAFYGCYASEIKLHDRITRIGNSAFSSSWGKPTDETLPAALTELGDSAYYGTRQLQGRVVIPDGVFRIGYYALSSCRNITELVLPEMLRELSMWALSNNSALTSVTIPEGITEIPEGCFEDCSSLTELVLPNGVETIDYNAFSGMTALTSLTIPSSVTSIKGSNFDEPAAITVYGCAGTAAQVFADEYGLQFVDITCHATAVTSAKEMLYLPVGQVIKPELQIAPANTTDAVKLSVSDETVARVINGRFLEGLRPGTVTVTATAANGCSCSFRVTVAVLSGLEIRRLPEKTFYQVGEPLDTTGMQVVMRFADGTDAPAEKYLSLGYDPETLGKQTIHVGWGDVWTSFPIHIVEPLSGDIRDNLQWTLSYGNKIGIRGTLTASEQIYAASYDTAGRMLSIGIIDAVSDEVDADRGAAQIKLFLTDRSGIPLLNQPVELPMDEVA